MKRCLRCKAKGPFGVDRRRPDGLAPYCKPCRATDSRVARAADPTYRRSERDRYRANPDKWKAKEYARRAVKSGKIAKADHCERCSGIPVEMHHHRGYAREFWLTISWLCRSCHKLAHVG